MKRALRVVAIGLAVLLVLLAVVPLLVPVPPLATVPPRELAYPDSQFVPVQVRGIGVDVHTRQVGQGDRTFVLLHGFASSLYSWHRVIDPLAAQGRVIALDWMPYGLTERPLPNEWRGAEGSPYSRAAQVDLVLAVMDALGVERAVLVGNSAGGALAASVALRAPERVEALVLVDAAISVPGAEDGDRRGLFGLLQTPAGRAVARTPQMRRVGPLLVRGISEWGVEFGRSAWHDPSKLTDEDWENYLLPLQADHWDRALYEGVIAPPGTPVTAADLAALGARVLVITGDDDRVVPTENSVRLAGLLPGAGLAVLPACGHAPQEECPQAFLDAVDEFIGSLPDAQAERVE